ncbi:uncharacterized protein LOC133204649 [Saccostrea echinata]|uniref:uncharacterized protein LOC133204649 n=1 Tax=Saccostrea echinata TaxID=191078 RepID=UPI002A7FA3F2|nr:uncharacterized protein LOC133204649 [Saccostrea echinata]
MKLQFHSVIGLLQIPRCIFTNNLKRSISTKHFSKHGCMFRTEAKSSKVDYGQKPRSAVFEQCKVSLPFIATRGLHLSHKDHDIVDLLEQGCEPLPSDLGLCTYTPKGAYLYLLETLHESLTIDWQLSILLSSILIRLAIIPLTMKRQKEIERRNKFTAGICVNSILCKEQKKKAEKEEDKDYQDLQKLQNSILNNLIFHRSFVYSKLREYLPQIVATLIFADSILNLEALVGRTYICPPDGANYQSLILLMFILTMSPMVMRCLQPGNEKSIVFVSFTGLLWLAIIDSMSMKLRLFLLPMLSVSAVLKILKKYIS